MNLLITLSLILIVSYTLALCHKTGGVPYSISDTYYKLRHKQWFSGTLIGTTSLLTPAILELSHPDTAFMAFLSVAGMWVVAIHPDFKVERKPHVAGALITLLCSQVWVACNRPLALTAWIPLLMYLAVYLYRTGRPTFATFVGDVKPLFWIEVCSLASVYIALYGL